MVSLDLQLDAPVLVCSKRPSVQFLVSSIFKCTASTRRWQQYDAQRVILAQRFANLSCRKEISLDAQRPHADENSDMLKNRFIYRYQYSSFLEVRFLLSMLYTTSSLIFRLSWKPALAYITTYRLADEHFNLLSVWQMLNSVLPSNALNAATYPNNISILSLRVRCCIDYFLYQVQHTQMNYQLSTDSIGPVFFFVKSFRSSKYFCSSILLVHTVKHV